MLYNFDKFTHRIWKTLTVFLKAFCEKYQFMNDKMEPVKMDGGGGINITILVSK